MDVVSEHPQYIILVHNDIEFNYNKVVEEDNTIRDLATLTDKDAPSLVRIREIIDGSKAIHPDFKPYNFQYAGVGAMLLIFGVADLLEVGVSNLKTAGSISKLSIPEEEQMDFDFKSALAELMN